MIQPNPFYIGEIEIKQVVNEEKSIFKMVAIVLLLKLELLGSRFFVLDEAVSQDTKLNLGVAVEDNPIWVLFVLHFDVAIQDKILLS